MKKDSPTRKSDWSYLDTDLNLLAKGIPLTIKDQESTISHAYRPVSRNSITSFRSKAAGRVSNGKVAGTSIGDDLSVDKAIASPFPKSGFRTPKRTPLDSGRRSPQPGSFLSSRKSLGYEPS